MAADCDAATTRAQDALFISQCSLAGLQAKLPLPWPTPPDTPPCPKRTYRSHYAYRGWQDLLNSATGDNLSDFDLCLRLIDFSGLRPDLAQRLGWISASALRPRGKKTPPPPSCAMCRPSIPPCTWMRLPGMPVSVMQLIYTWPMTSASSGSSTYAPATGRPGDDGTRIPTFALADALRPKRDLRISAFFLRRSTFYVSAWYMCTHASFCPFDIAPRT